jgi:hypothetical protein
VSVEHRYTCEVEDCNRNWSDQGLGGGNLPPGLLYLRETQGDGELHFCSWDCLLKFAAKFPPSETIPFTPLQGDEDAA